MNPPPLPAAITEDRVVATAREVDPTRPGAVVRELMPGALAPTEVMTGCSPGEVGARARALRDSLGGGAR